MAEANTTGLHLRPAVSAGYCASIYRDREGHGWMVAQVCNGVDNERIAQLFVAAPELLEACVEMLQEMIVWEDHQGTHPAATKARAAIAKATGGAQ